jgi:hypothetical protein
LPAEIISRCRIKAGQQWRNEKLAKAKDIITNSDSSKELANIVNELSDNNFTVEASMLLADAARVQDKPLWELEVLLALTGALDGSKAVLPVLYALAVLLRRINEPKLAMDYFQKIMQIEKNFSDVSQQIEELKYDPFMKLTFENDIRGDLIQKERFLQEIEKYTILNKKFLWSAVIETGEMHDCRVCLRGSDITHSISRAVEKYKESVCSVELRQVSLYTGKKLSEIPCVYIQSTKKIMPIAVGLEIYSDAGGTGFIPHGIFDIKQLDIPSEIPANEHNRQVEEVWKNICNCDDAKAWLNNICHISFEAVKGLIGARSDTVY